MVDEISGDATQLESNRKAGRPSYVVISPVRDEASYVELTLRSIAAQTSPPVEWVIVDDGSRDETAAIVRRYSETHPYIRLIRNQRDGVRNTGSAEIAAFSQGCAALNTRSYDFIVKLDGDLEFEPTYFESLLGRFAQDAQLGIASGVYLEKPSADTAWRQISMPSYHAFGACKVVRRTCFEAIGGFVLCPGWDSLDEIRANTLGWRTGHFTDLQVRHHKREGSAMGLLTTSAMHGEIYYGTGGDPLLFFLKIASRLMARPWALGAAALTYGYLKALVTRQPKLVTAEETAVYRRLMRARLRRGPAGASA